CRSDERSDIRDRNTRMSLSLMRTTTARTPSMYLGLGRRRAREQEIEIAAFVGLAYMLREHRAIAALVMRLRRRPGGFPTRQRVIADMQMNAPVLHIHLDLVAGLHEGERSADEALGRDMQDAGAVARAA